MRNSYNEAAFVKLDRVLALARKWGVKITVPVINDDYGSQDSNYVRTCPGSSRLHRSFQNGNWADLIQLYYGITGDNAYYESKAYNFWTDPDLVNATKKIYTKLLDRTNTVNGVRYGDDNTFWAIETGNELKCESRVMSLTAVST